MVMESVIIMERAAASPMQMAMGSVIIRTGMGGETVRGTEPE